MSKGKILLLTIAAAVAVYPLTPVITEALGVGAIVDDYILHVIALALVYTILSMGLNIVPGFCGLLDLGYVGFYGIGAYTAGLLTVHYGMSFWVVLPLAALNGAIWGILLGAPTLRLTGDYFAIVTFGFSELVVLFLTNEIWLTRGPQGLPGIDPITVGNFWFYDPITLFGVSLPSELPYYYLAILLVLFIYFMMRRMEDSRLGRAWFAIREDPLAASSCGVNLLVYKVIAFAISAAIGAIAGSFFARWHMFLHPDMFKFWESFLVLCMVVLGGLGNISGAIIGALVLIGLGEVLREALPYLGLPTETRFLFYGLVMILIMRFKPNGFVPRIATAGLSNPLLVELRKKLQSQKA